jgi:hypothetical protein
MYDNGDFLTYLWCNITDEEFYLLVYEVGLKVFGFIKKTSCGIEKLYLLYIFPPNSTHLWLCCSNFFNPSKKNSFGCAANRKVGNRKTQRLISTPMYNPVCSVESQPTFQRNISPPSSGSKSKPSKKPAWKWMATCFHTGFLLGLFFNHEDGGDIFLQNISWLSIDYTALYPRR